VLPEENSGQVADFLAAAPDFTAVHSTEIWRAQFGEAHAGRWRVAGDGVLLTPHTTGTDGFFVSVMTRA
jgi:16S rRNA (cytosine967-C5)-methyltransferase